jgi:hypothetical protein
VPILKSPLLAGNLPFHPLVHIESLTDLAVSELSNPLLEPASTISILIIDLLETHIDLNLTPFIDNLKVDHSTTQHDLKMFNFGYTYVLNSVIVSRLCKNTSPGKERFNLFNASFNPSRDPLVWSMRTKMQIDLNATINLLKLDPSAAFVFQFTEDYPYSTSPYFLAGLEVASVVYFKLSQEVSDQLPQLTWLREWQGISTMS